MKKKEQLQLLGNYGCYIGEDNVLSFRMGDSAQLSLPDGEREPVTIGFVPEWMGVSGFNVLSRGINNLKCEEIESDIKKNRLLPQLIRKQRNILYGQGPAVYLRKVVDGKYVRQWEEQPQIMEWLDSWIQNGMEMGYKDVAKAIVKNFYYFSDFFVKWRMTYGNRIGKMPVAGLEVLENKNCRLATRRTDVVTNLVNYKDFSHICVGRWYMGASTYQFYPRFTLSNYRDILYAGVSHHREKSVGEYYGMNETFEGARPYIKGSNETAGYINSFLKNSLAAKIHIIIPNAWLESKRQQITRLCEENKRRQQNELALFKYNDIEIGTDYKESTLIAYMQSELRKISQYLSGEKNQGKAYASISFKGSSGDMEQWQFENIDMKYKEYIESLILYDKRADEALLSSVGLDASISSVSKDGVISKSGADVYYNYLIYLMQLNPDDELCAEPFNMAIQLNFPELYRSGYRFGFYRETPTRQEDVSPNDRLNKQQS